MPSDTFNFMNSSPELEKESTKMLSVVHTASDENCFGEPFDFEILNCLNFEANFVDHSSCFNGANTIVLYVNLD